MQPVTTMTPEEEVVDLQRRMNHATNQAVAWYQDLQVARKKIERLRAANKHLRQQVSRMSGTRDRDEDRRKAKAAESQYFGGKR